jgi:hypothetical protein
LQPADRQRFGREDLLYLPEVVAEAADAIAARRRRSFRWCRSCRRVQARSGSSVPPAPPQQCAWAHADLDS